MIIIIRFLDRMQDIEECVGVFALDSGNGCVLGGGGGVQG